eukprot:CAMPEP_0180820842 /NCGR_PEP_ID=MMETSP1038_2-20121128/70505_1 /TAXON_ID=632150 /ORGANISM="Azadinium spinosum, Strain 3D9" /LENGTH=151 /DNA_ID=CAMNT_0022862969 /DNA_START=16 /DNA_END=468 /DNA_ORIENTATION=+
MAVVIVDALEVQGTRQRRHDTVEGESARFLDLLAECLFGSQATLKGPRQCGLDGPILPGLVRPLRLLVGPPMEELAEVAALRFGEHLAGRQAPQGLSFQLVLSAPLQATAAAAARDAPKFLGVQKALEGVRVPEAFPATDEPHAHSNAVPV